MSELHPRRRTRMAHRLQALHKTPSSCVYHNPSLLDLIILQCDQPSLAALSRTSLLLWESAGKRLFRDPSINYKHLKSFVRGWERTVGRRFHKGQRGALQPGEVLRCKKDLFNRHFQNTLHIDLYERDWEGWINSSGILLRAIPTDRLHLCYHSPLETLSNYKMRRVRSRRSQLPRNEHGRRTNLYGSRYSRAIHYDQGRAGAHAACFEVFGSAYEWASIVHDFERGILYASRSYSLILNLVPNPHHTEERDPVIHLDPPIIDPLSPQDIAEFQTRSPSPDRRAPNDPRYSHTLCINFAAAFRRSGDGSIVDRAIVDILRELNLLLLIFTALIESTQLTVYMIGLDHALDEVYGYCHIANGVDPSNSFIPEPRNWRGSLMEAISHLWTIIPPTFSSDQIKDAKRRLVFGPPPGYTPTRYHFFDEFHVENDRMLVDPVVDASNTDDMDGTSSMDDMGDAWEGMEDWSDYHLLPGGFVPDDYDEW